MSKRGNPVVMHRPARVGEVAVTERRGRAKRGFPYRTASSGTYNALDRPAADNMGGDERCRERGSARRPSWSWSR